MANNGGNKSGYSIPQKFTSSIKAPVLLSPAKNEDSVSVTPKLEWSNVDGATKYKVQISTAPLFNSQYIVVDVDTITTNSFITPQLQASKSHYWKVFSLTDEYVGPSSDFSRFVTGNVTSIKYVNEIPSKFNLSQNYPNPFNPSTQITYQLPENSFVDIVVYNSIGQLVAKLINNYQAKGNYTISFDATNLPSGIYIYKLNAGDFSASRKMLVVK
jgi:hypothetical protein